MSEQHHLDRLLDSNLQNYLELFEVGKVDDFLQHKQDFFKTKIDTLGVQNVAELNNKLCNMVLAQESNLRKALPLGVLQQGQHINKVVAEIFQYLIKDNPAFCLFLSSSAAAKLLIAHPPVNILEAVGESELLNWDPLAVLSLTRHTESVEWQKRYLRELKKISNDSFETRTVSYQVVDHPAILALLTKSEMKQKPWRISHAKETGYINIFTHSDSEEDKRRAPLLQFAIVLFHYFFEAMFAGVFFNEKMRQPDQRVADSIVDVISTGQDKFPFFHPNSYSEHLYWMRGMEAFQKYFSKQVDLTFFSDTLTCGHYFDNTDTEPISLNFVDLVWDANIAFDSAERDYFQFSSHSFLYHFREGFWYETITHLLELEPIEMDSFVRLHLDCGDQALTKELIGTYHGK